MVLIDDDYKKAEKEAQKLKDIYNIDMTKEQINERATQIRLERTGLLPHLTKFGK